MTPLFCIGATLGAAFAHLTHQPVGFFAALGFVAVFAGAAKVPLTGVVLGVELFGAGLALPLIVVCFLAGTLGGQRGIYTTGYNPPMALTKTFEQLCADAKTRIPEVSTDDVARIRTERSPVVIDVREQDEFRAGHLPGARGIGRGILEYHIADEVPDPDTEIILYCRGGNRSALAADSLRQMGYTNVSSMTGGFRQWDAEGREQTTDGEPIAH